MILVTRLNGSQFYINPEFIKFIEKTPNTVVTLINQEKLIVSESVDQVIERFIEYQRDIRIPKQQPGYSEN